MRIAIHQPNFFPWLPFFEKMAAVDKFIILTQCQFEKGGYQNRFNIGETWYTMSVESGMHPIEDKNYLQPEEDFAKIQKKFPILEGFENLIHRNLSRTNVGIIRSIAELLNIETEIVLDYPTPLKSTDRLIDICLRHGGTSYLAGPSGGNYMELCKFQDVGIKIEFQKKQTKRPIVDVLREVL